MDIVVSNGMITTTTSV